MSIALQYGTLIVCRHGWGVILSIFMGVMSGTSVDAIDVVLADWRLPQQPKLIAHHSHDWPAPLRDKILAMASGQLESIDALGQLDHAIAAESAIACMTCLAQSGLTAADVTAIGFHGQTIRHRPNLNPAFTLQIGDANLLAERTGIAVVSDFRRRDMAAGGQGAPLVPAFHENVFGHGRETTVVLNLGGIANITVIPSQDSALPTVGFDTGPANMLLDAWCYRHTQQPYDAGGRWASSGRVDTLLLKRLLAHPYFQQAAPKSTGREQFGLSWLDGELDTEGRKITAQDVQATLTELTALSVSQSIEATSPHGTGDVIVCGGGAFNETLMSRLATRLPRWRVTSSQSKGLDPQCIESLAFAWLARQMMLGLAGNLPAVTGAEGPRVLGAYHPAGLGRAFG
jgi:anhydro-N-acetylmuramic acid kinase